MRLRNLAVSITLIASTALVVGGVAGCGTSCTGTVTAAQLLAPGEVKLTVRKPGGKLCYVNGPENKLVGCTTGERYPGCAGG